MIELHPWDVDDHTAIMIQEWLRSRVVEAEVCNINHVGIYNTGASVTLDIYTWPALLRVEREECSWDTEPRPSFLEAFNYVQPMGVLLDIVDTSPDMLIVDRPGVCHPRRFGVASHLGVLAELPTIGVSEDSIGTVVGNEVHMDPISIVWGKTRALEFGIDPRDKVYPPLVGRVVGDRYVSVGNMITLDAAVAAVEYIVEAAPDILGGSYVETLPPSTQL